MKTIQDLTQQEINHILQESSTYCYSTIAREHDVCINTVKRIVRTYSRQSQSIEG